MNKNNKDTIISKSGQWYQLRNRDQSLELGMFWQYENYKIVFGNKNFSDNEILEQYSNVELLKIKQIHSAKVVLASTELQEADAHYTASSNMALQIKTADCMPVFMFDSNSKIIMAIHSGWRGVANKIVEVAVNELIKMGTKVSHLRVVIGPHIRKQSFEVDQPVWVEIMDSIPIEYHHESNRYFEKYSVENSSNQEKYIIDLEGILKTQLYKMGISEDKIDSLPNDTLTDLRWNSHRRDKEKSGRNISFILRESI